jgi:hypothetical protein
MQQTIPPANKFASGLAPDPQRWAYIEKYKNLKANKSTIHKNLKR